MPKRFRFRYQRFLDYRTFKTDQARRRIMQASAALEEAENKLAEANAQVAAAQNAIEQSKAEAVEVRRQSWEAEGDWSRTIERARQAVSEAEAELNRRLPLPQRARYEVEAKRPPLEMARAAQIHAQRFQDRLASMRDQQKREFAKQQEAVEMEDAAEAFSATAWIERGES